MGVWIFSSVMFVTVVYLLSRYKRFRVWALWGTLIVMVLAALSAAAIFYIDQRNATEREKKAELAASMIKPSDLSITMYFGQKKSSPTWEACGAVTNGSLSTLDEIKFRFVVLQCPSKSENSPATSSDQTCGGRKCIDLMDLFKVPVDTQMLNHLPNGCTIIGDRNAEWTSLNVPPEQKRALQCQNIYFDNMFSSGGDNWSYAIVGTAADLE